MSSQRVKRREQSVKNGSPGRKIVDSHSDAMQERLRLAFVQLMITENGLEGLAAKKRHRKFAARHWPDGPSFEGVLELVDRVFDLVVELGPRKVGRRPKDRKRGSAGRPREYSDIDRTNLLAIVQQYKDQQQVEGLQPTDAEAVRRYLKAANRYGSWEEFKADEEIHKRRVSYFRRPRRKI